MKGIELLDYDSIDYYGIVVVILLSVTSNVIIWKPSKKEYREFKVALRKTCRRQP